MDTGKKDGSYYKNYKLFEKKIKEYKTKKDHSEEEMTKLIDTILDYVIVLPIECTNYDSALVIFETINDRGLPLRDSDIFKSKIHKSAS